MDWVTQLLQHERRLLQAAEDALGVDADAGTSRPVDDVAHVLAGCWKVLVAHLTHARLHPSVVDELQRNDAAGLTELIDALQRTIVSLLVMGSDVPDPLTEAFRHLRQVLTPQANAPPPLDAPSPFADDLDVDVDVDVDEPSPFETEETRPWSLAPASDVMHAVLDESVETAPTASAAPEVVPQILLLLQALHVDVAMALQQALRPLLMTAGARQLPSMPDCVVLVASGDAGDAATRLLRLCAQLFEPVDGDAVLAAMVTCTSDRGDVDAVVVDAVIRARRAAQREGLVAVDADCMVALGASVAEVPGARGCIDPKAPFRHDRWELSALLQRPPMLDRADEVQQVVSFLRDDVPDDDDGAQSPLLLLHGPLGLGKSTLLRRALAEAGFDDETAPVLWGATDDTGHTPLSAIRSMVRALARAASGEEGSWTKLRRLLVGLAGALDVDEGKELLRLGPLLAYLLGAQDEALDVPIDDEIASFSTRLLHLSMRRALYLVVKAMLQRGGRDRVVLVVTSAEAIDGATREFLVFLARHLKDKLRCIWMSATKVRLSKTLLASFAEHRLELSPLDKDTSLAIAAAVIDESPDALPELKALCRRAGGSPLSLLHTMRLAVESGHLVQRDGRWQFSDLKARSIGGRAQRVIEARLELLPPTERQVLRICAALGKVITPASVEVVAVHAQMAAADAKQAVAVLMQTGFLARSTAKPGAPAFPSSGDTDELIVFEHPLVRVVALQDLDGHPDAAAIHGHVAQAFLTLVPDGIAALSAKLAVHHDHAGAQQDAADMYLVAARRARRLEHAAGAMKLLQRGLDLCGDDVEQQFHFTRELERIHEAQFSLGAQRLALDEMQQQADQLNTPPAIGLARQRQARFFAFRGHYEEAVDCCIESLAAFRAADDRRGRAQTLRLLALCRFERREWQAAINVLHAARALLDDDDRRSLGIVEHQIGLLWLEAGAPVDALEHLLTAYEHRLAVFDEGAAAACLDAMGDVFVRTGRWHTAVQVLQKAMAHQHRLGDEAGRARTLCNLGQVRLLLGDAVEAAAHAQDARQLAQALHLRRLERTATVLAARAALQQEDEEHAERLVNALRRRVEAAEDPFATMEAALLSGRAKWLRAHKASSSQARDRLLKTAGERAREAAALGERHGYASGQMMGMALLGEVLLETGDASSALPFSQRAAELVSDRASTSLPTEQVLLTHAQVLLALGDADEAQAVLDDTLQTLTSRADALPDAWQDRFWALPVRQQVRDAHEQASSTS